MNHIDEETLRHDDREFQKIMFIIVGVFSLFFCGFAFWVTL